MNAKLSHWTFSIQGLTCSACERRVEALAGAQPGVRSARADAGRGRLRVTVDASQTTPQRLMSDLAEPLAAHHYTITGQLEAESGQAVTWALAGGVIGLFLLASAQGWLSFLPTIDSTVSLGMLFVAGLLTSVHCVAMCGGIVLTQQARPGGWRYHAGRVVAYSVLGGIVGALGAVISFSPVTKGLLAGIAGLFMLSLGLRMLGVWPRWLTIRWPRWLPVGLERRLRQRGPFIVGLLNGLMPCGPLQTMQLYALGTGSFALGALSMFLFSLGTIPLLFGFGALSRAFSPRWQGRLAKVSAVLVIFLALIMAGRALELSGASGALQTWMARPTSAPEPDQAAVAVVEANVQTVGFDLEPTRYKPITVQRGIPVRWTITATAANLTGCNSEIVIPQLNLRKKLAVGANIIEFTPQTSGTLSYTCWMGMISSSIQVVDRLEAGAVVGEPALPADFSPAGSCCGAGEFAPIPSADSAPSTGVATLKTEGDKKIQEITVTVTAQGYNPSTLVLQRGLPVRIRFVVQQLTGCNRFVGFPDYGGGLDLGRGQLVTPLLPVERDFQFQCGMGMLHGSARVVEDISRPELRSNP